MSNVLFGCSQVVCVSRDTHVTRNLNKMPGIDRQRIVDKSEDELDELSCGICQDIFTDPVVTPCCRHTYCSLCIYQWLIGNNSCPNDRQRLSSRDMIPAPRMVINLLNKLKIKCENHSKGCEVIMSIADIDKHLLVCDKNCDSCKSLKTKISESEIRVKKLKTQLVSLENEVKSLREILGRNGSSHSTEPIKRVGLQ